MRGRAARGEAAREPRRGFERRAIRRFERARVEKKPECSKCQQFISGVGEIFIARAWFPASSVRVADPMRAVI
jgi:hypothetical protein